MSDKERVFVDDSGLPQDYGVDFVKWLFDTKHKWSRQWSILSNFIQTLEEISDSLINCYKTRIFIFHNEDMACPVVIKY